MELLHSLRARESAYMWATFSRLWHQLSEAVQEYISTPKPDLEQFCRSFLFSVETHFNRMEWAKIAIKIAKSAKDPIAFMEEIRSRFREKQSAPSAWNLLTLALAQHHLRANHTEQAEELLRSTREALGIVSDEELPLTSPLRESDGSTAIKDDVLSLYYAVLAEQAQTNNDALKFYRYSLRYLSFTDLSSIPAETKVQLAFSLGIAALLGKDLYTFGELIMHPILQSLISTPLEWMYRVLCVFNEGDLQKYEHIVEVYKEQLKSQPALLQNPHILRDKIRLSSFIALVFRTPPDKRIISFADIAANTKLPLAEVEFLVMKALSLGLVRGKIDANSCTVHIEYVQPRMLADPQIKQLRERIAGWTEKLDAALHFVETETLAATPV